MSKEEFMREYLCDFVPEENKFTRLAKEYHDTCDKYDEALCPPNGKPTTGQEHGLINRHASKVLRNIAEREHLRGYGKSSLLNAIRNYKS